LFGTEAQAANVCGLPVIMAKTFSKKVLVLVAI
jgi:hypothetical protein